MEIRREATTGRTISGVCVPYDEISYLTPNPTGERVVRGAFTKSATQRLTKLFLYRDHEHERPVGRAVSFADEPDGLHGTFQIRESVLGDETLADIRDGFLPAMSVGFRAVQVRRAADGVMEVVEAQLLEVSLVSLPAYDGAQVLALRSQYNAQRLQLLQVNLSPVVPGWVYDPG